MVHWQDFSLDTVQASMFTPAAPRIGTSRSTAIILRMFGDAFDGEMQALSLPAEVPPEIPRVMLKSNDGLRQLGIGPARFDYTWLRSTTETSLDLQIALGQILELFVYYVQETKVPVGRLALILNRTLPTEYPAQALVEHFCTERAREGPFKRSANFEIHNHKEYRPIQEGIDYDINSWVRCITANRAPDEQRVILVSQDLNTLKSDSSDRKFNGQQIQAFYSMAADEAEQIITKYFPG